MGFEFQAEFVSQARVRVTGTVDIFQKEQEDTCTLIENGFVRGFEGSCSHDGGEVGVIFLAPFSSCSYFLHVFFESKLLLEQTQIQTKPVNKRKTETAGS